MPEPVKKKRKSKKKRFIRLRPGKWLFDLLLCFLALTVVPVLIYSVANPSTTMLMWIRWVESDYGENMPLAFMHWNRLERISPHLIKAVVAAEDQKYFQHNGFDWQAIESAIRVNLTTERKIGASTISMQTARNVFLWQKRTWLRKSLETYFTFLIETFWDKGRIMEVYLNVIEWGDGVYGCEAAAQEYFNHSCATLSPVEAAGLAAILPNPRRWSLHRPGKYVAHRQAKILKTLERIRLPRLD
ncbi:MAG: monofunctional biosynthetic peptidoglycan transglycosylase [Nitrospinaceae bacterium]|jgi:monofunctional biosynthetic peptidoglycan transglycosylase|nr:MAG: monofunctional biosynthetic peptidoglycan transglycosylase [Nitrospinaceae bacterium]